MATLKDTLAGATGNYGSDAADAGRAIGEKTRMLKEATAPSSPAPKPAAPSKPSPSDLVNPKARYGDRPGEKRIDTSKMTPTLGSFKKGGKVKKTGVYKLHKGERVLNRKQTAKMTKNVKGMAILGGVKG